MLAKRAHEPPLCADAREPSRTSPAFASMSTSKKARMPAEIPFRSVLSLTFCISTRAIGRPRKIVNPATAPRTATSAVLITATFRGHADDPDPVGSARAESYLRGRIRGKFVYEPSLDVGSSPRASSRGRAIGALVRMRFVADDGVER